MNFHSHKELVDDLDTIAAAFPNHAKTFIVGKSVKNQPLYGIRLSRNLNLGPNLGIFYLTSKS